MLWNGLELWGYVGLCRPINSPLMFAIQTVACVDNPPFVDHNFERGKPQWAFPRGFCMANPWGKCHFWWSNGEILVLVGAIPLTLVFSPKFMLNFPLSSHPISLSNTLLLLKSIMLNHVQSSFLNTLHSHSHPIHMPFTCHFGWNQCRCPSFLPRP